MNVNGTAAVSTSERQKQTKNDATPDDKGRIKIPSRYKLYMKQDYYVTHGSHAITKSGTKTPISEPF
jgi:hypothetical protein